MQYKQKTKIVHLCFLKVWQRQKITQATKFRILLYYYYTQGCLENTGEAIRREAGTKNKQKIETRIFLKKRQTSSLNMKVE